MGDALGSVVVVHQLERLFHGQITTAVTDGGDEESEITAAVGEDAQVAGEDLPDDVEAVTPGIDLGKSVIGERIDQRFEVGSKDLLIGKFHGPKPKSREGVVWHK